MPLDLAVNYRNIQDESLIERDGSTVKYKRYDFFLGKFGPFTERIPLEGFTDQAIVLRIQALKAHIELVSR